uniref:Putative ethanolamine/propanediol utilisation protein n=1 Tax=termite gut metagenome TaxID=433724 RepID=S0DFE7_9ZZZZ
MEGTAIDTPGEYIENRKLMYALTVTSVEADIILFTQSAASDFTVYSPGQASMFPTPVLGVVTKIDVAGEEQIRWAAELLQLAGVEKVFLVSNTDGTGIQELLDYLNEKTF